VHKVVPIVRHPFGADVVDLELKVGEDGLRGRGQVESEDFCVFVSLGHVECPWYMLAMAKGRQVELYGGDANENLLCRLWDEGCTAR
jgi:hypothetical protein